MLPALVLLLAFVIVPLVTLLVFSLYTSVSPLRGFTWQQYTTLVHETLYLRVLWKTIYVALFVTVIAGAIAWPAGWIVSRLPQRRQVTVIALVIVPYLTSYLLLVYAMYVVIAPHGPLMAFLGSLHLASASSSILYTPWATVVMLVYESVPIMVLVMYAGSERISASLIQAAQSLGAGKVAVFRRVIVPLSLPSLLTGSVLVFVPTLGAFAEPAILGGPNGLLIGNIINDQINVVDNQPFAAALCFVLLAVVLLAGLAVWTGLRLLRRSAGIQRVSRNALVAGPTGASA
jgi:ABC-type spermidine/putrescine transport system permease subunit I